ncbi:MAG: NAD(P)H-hydrate epimerase [Candidatus Micrarchaeia archaeon]
MSKLRYITTTEMRMLEDAAETKGISKLQLMENAGKGASEFILTLKPKRVIVFCGRGNNGGDGLVCARYLFEAGCDVCVFISGEPASYEAKANFERIRKMPIVLTERLEETDALLRESDIVVDALLGTGAKGRLREPIRSCVVMINSSNAIKIALDIPTGIDPDTGDVCDIAVKPDFTLTFHLPKKGLEKAECGRLIVIDIGIPNVSTSSP